MKKHLFAVPALLLAAITITASGCQKKEPPDPAGFTAIPTTANTAESDAEAPAGVENLGNESSYKVKQTEYFSLSSENVTAESVTVRLKNNIDQTLAWGAQYSLEKNVDGVWREVKVKDGKEYGWTMEMHTLEGNEETSFDIVYGSFYSLSGGSYRIVKEYEYLQPVDGAKIKMYAACEFELEFE
ncbi:MAG: hypothetical protein NC120_11235 [Ruminococcus sp.]|nr:hypothetical protein [Ruminococcus sp.]